MTKFFFANGSRKEATSKVWVYPEGSGQFKVNNQNLEQYFGRQDLVNIALAPLKVTNLLGQVDVKCFAAGGGKSGQAGAVALGLARALVNYNSEFRKVLRSTELLKRDPREKERCKYGLAKRRKRFQWTKR